MWGIAYHDTNCLHNGHAAYGRFAISGVTGQIKEDKDMYLVVLMLRLSLELC